MMKNTVSVLMFVAMAPIGLLATNLRTTDRPEFDERTSAPVWTSAAVAGAEHGRRELSYATELSDVLELHNEARCLHNADSLVYTTTLTASATTHAETLTSNCGDFYHSSTEYGENLYRCGTTSQTSCFTADGAMEALYEDEIEGANSVTDYGEHATQILWKSTTELGCALADCTEGVWNYVYLVCQYNPAGNILAILEQEVELLSPDNSC